MPATYALLGEPDLVGLLIYLFIFLASLGGFAFVVVFIYMKVFRAGGPAVVSINPAAEAQADEQR